MGGVRLGLHILSTLFHITFSRNVFDEAVIFRLVFAKELVGQCLDIKGILNVFYLYRAMFLIKFHEILSCCVA